ncbi:UNVERIFIED_CONTAM: hypothetical protein GTU68_064800 [Idotea baltica]|nr:hypothetical protein [Idotea baltica]
MDSPPPRLDVHDKRHPFKDRRYKFINEDLLPNAECLSDIVDRLKPLYVADIQKKLKAKKKLLIVAHGSSLRALISLMNPTFKEDQIKNFDIPSAIPIIISYRENLESIKF